MIDECLSEYLESALVRPVILDDVEQYPGALDLRTKKFWIRLEISRGHYAAKGHTQMC